MFSTKHREPLIHSDVRPDLHAYLVGTLNALDGHALVVGGVADHVHLLFLLSKTLAPAKAIEEVKKESSKWAKAKVHPRFYWQAGYGIFSVSASNEESVIAYIRDQENHHTEMTFEDEVRRLTEKHRQEIDERYFWDWSWRVAALQAANPFPPRPQGVALGYVVRPLRGQNQYPSTFCFLPSDPCPLPQRRSFCGSASHTRSVWSPDPDTSRVPSGLNASA